MLKLKRNQTVIRALASLLGAVLILGAISASVYAEWIGGDWQWQSNPIYGWAGGDWQWQASAGSAAAEPAEKPAAPSMDADPNGLAIQAAGGKWVFAGAEQKEVGETPVPSVVPARPATGQAADIVLPGGRWVWVGGVWHDNDWNGNNDDGGGKEEHTVTFDADGGYFGRDRGDGITRVRVEDGDRIGNLPSSPRRSGYDFDGWVTSGGRAFTSRSVVTRDIRVYADWNRRGSGWDDDRWEGSRYEDPDDARYRPEPPRPAPSANVTSSGEVNPGVLLADANKALLDADVAANVRVKNARSISIDTVRSLDGAAKNAGKGLTLLADTMRDDSRTVDARLYIDPAALLTAGGTLRIDVSTTNQAAMDTKAVFERWFSNTVAVVSCGQSGVFGVPMQIAALADLSGMDRSSLLFYAYDRETSQYTPITDPRYNVDSNGYVHFYTAYAGDIVITDRPMSK